MTTMNHNFLETNVPQNVRDQNARQLRADFLAGIFKAFCKKFFDGVTQAGGEVRVNSQF